MRALGHAGALRRFLRALALVAAADQNLAALVLGAAGIQLGGAGQFNLVAQHGDVPAVRPLGGERAGDSGTVGAADDDVAALVGADRIGNHMATDADHRFQGVQRLLRAHDHGAILGDEGAGVGHAVALARL
ncbi:hypothetical protein D9M70_478320 [compost metagenome]